MPSENELAREFRWRMTVNRALRELTAEQVLTRMKGRAPTSRRSTSRRWWRSAASRRKSAHAGMRSRQRARPRHDPRRRRARRRDAGRRAHEAVSFAGAALRERRLVQLEERWVNPAVAPDYAKQDFTNTTPNLYLMRAAPLQRVEYRIEAAARRRSGATAADGRRRAVFYIDAPPGRRASSPRWRIWHPGSRYRFTGHF